MYHHARPLVSLLVSCDVRFFLDTLALHHLWTQGQTVSDTNVVGGMNHRQRIALLAVAVLVILWMGAVLVLLLGIGSKLSKIESQTSSIESAVSIIRLYGTGYDSYGRKVRD